MVPDDFVIALSDGGRIPADLRRRFDAARGT